MTLPAHSNSGPRRYLAVIQDARGYPAAGLEKAPPEGPAAPVILSVVRADEHEAEVERLREEVKRQNGWAHDLMRERDEARAELERIIGG